MLKKPCSEKEFHLLLSFLNDDNEKTQSLVRHQLKEVVKRYPSYRKSVRTLKDKAIKERAEMFFDELRYAAIEPEFRALFENEKSFDLEKGLYLLATIEYPNLKYATIKKTLDEMAKKVERLMGRVEPHPNRPVTAMRKFLFQNLGFHGNEKNYNDPDNSFINKVLERKIGIPISLSCIYLLIAWRLKLPVHGVGLPGHFVVGHRIPRSVVYIDPFKKGKILRAKDCEVMVKRLGLPFKQVYLDPMKKTQILSRVIANLVNIYNDRGDVVRAHWLAKLFQFLD